MTECRWWRWRWGRRIGRFVFVVLLEGVGETLPLLVLVGLTAEMLFPFEVIFLGLQFVLVILVTETSKFDIYD